MPVNIKSAAHHSLVSNSNNNNNNNTMIMRRQKRGGGGSSSRRSSSSSSSIGTVKLISLIVCSICLLVSLYPGIKQVQCGRLQDFIQNLVNGRDSSSSSSSGSSSSSSGSSSNNGNSNSNSNSNSNDSSDSDAAATGESSANDQQLTPMMSGMNPFMRFPQFYFSPANYGAMSSYPGMSFSSPMGAMSGLSPAMTMSGSSLGGAFASPASFGPTSFGSFGSPAGGNPLSAFTGAGTGMGAASSLNNVYASSPSLMGGYAPYYGKKR